MAKEITATDIADYIMNSEWPMFDSDLYYVHLDRNCNLAPRYCKDWKTFTCHADLSEWEDDETPERLYKEFETKENKDFMWMCENLAFQIYEYLQTGGGGNEHLIY